MVLVFHFFTLSNNLWTNFQNDYWYRLLYEIAYTGRYGVSLFFVLSGFLLTGILLKEASEKDKINPLNFLFRRILRIWPLYFLIVVFGFLIFPHLPYGIETKHSLLNFSTFLSNIDEIWYGSNDPLNFLTVTWSISIEEQFYLLLIALLFLLPFLRKGKHFAIYFLGLIVASLIFRFLYYGDPRIMYYHSISNVSGLAVGGLCAILIRKESFVQYFKNINRWLTLGIYGVGLSIIFLSPTVFSRTFATIQQLVIDLFFAFLILEQVYSNQSFWKADKLPYFFSLGKYTYGIYMFHCIFIYYLNIYFTDGRGSIFNFVFYGLLLIALTFATSYLSMRFFEGPILKLRGRFK